MTTRKSFLTRVAACYVMGVIAFAVTVAANTIPTATRARLLADDEAASIYGAAQGQVCSNTGGVNCAPAPKNACINGGTCPTNQFCNPVAFQAGWCGQLTNAGVVSIFCNVYLKNGNCCNTCQGGCYNWSGGAMVKDPNTGNLTCNGACVLPGQCGSALCKTVRCP